MRNKRDARKKKAERHDALPEKKGSGDGAGVDQTCLDLLRETAAKQVDLTKDVSDLGGQNAFLRQQTGQLYDAVRQLYDAVGTQCRQLLASDQNLQQELQRFQTGGPQRAMAGVFHKLFRDLIHHVAELDGLLTCGQKEAQGESDAAWLKSLEVARDRFEAILEDWGCQPIPVEVGKQEFNPEIHESVVAQPGDIPESAKENVIVKVRRRGWTLHGYVLVPPQVVVN